MTKLNRLAFATILICTLASSCKREALLHSYRHTPAEGWEQSDVLTYPIDTVKNGGCYMLDIGVRTTNSFPYKKLWLIVEQQLNNPQKTVIDTLACNFVDEKEDRNGRGTNTYQYTFKLDKIKLEKYQYGKISIRHIMRREILPGVSDIGIKIYR